MNCRRWILLTLSLLWLGVGEAKAGFIAGPATFQVTGGSDTYWGIQFTALQNSTLTGVDYNHRSNMFGDPFTGTISLIDTTTSVTTVLDNYPMNAPQVIVLTPNVALKAGDVYQLVASSSTVSNANDEIYTAISSYGGTAPNYPVSDAEISITGGAFSSGGSSNTQQWGAFNNISTQAVPEPASLTLFGLGVAGVAGYAWRRRNLRTV